MDTARRDEDGAIGDAMVVAEVLAGHRELFRALVERYQGRVYGMVAHLVGDRELARDVAQDAFLSAFRGLASFDPSRPFAPWLFKIAQRSAFTALRRVRGRRETPDADLVADRASVEGHADAVVDREATRQASGDLVGLVAALDPKYRSAVLLRHREGLSLAETAEALEIPLGTVKSRLHEAYRILRARLGGEGRP